MPLAKDPNAPAPERLRSFLEHYICCVADDFGNYLISSDERPLSARSRRFMRGKKRKTDVGLIEEICAFYLNAFIEMTEFP